MVRLSRSALVFALAWLSGCAAFAPADDWTERDTALQAAYLGLLAADSITTDRIRDTPGLKESWPASVFIGEHPDTKDIVLYGATYALANYLIAKHLPPKWRKAWLWSHVGLHSAAIVNNCGDGLC